MPIIPKADVGVVREKISNSSVIGSNARANSGDFGGQQGRDLQQFGQTLEQVSARRLDRINRAILTDADNQYNTVAREIISNAQKLQGKDAFGAMETVNKQLAEARDRINKSLQSNAQSEMFNVRADRIDMHSKGIVDKHIFRQEVKYKNETNLATLYNINKNAQLMYQDGKDPFVLAEQAKENIAGTVINDYDSEEVQTHKMVVAMNNYHSEALRFIANDNPKLANEYIEKYKDEIDPDVIAKWEKALEPAVVEQNANAIVFDKEYRDLAPNDLRAELTKKGYSDKAINKAVSIRKDIISEQKKADDLRLGKMVESTKKVIEEYPYQPIPLSVKAELPTSKVKELEKYQKTVQDGLKVQDDSDTVAKWYKAFADDGTKYEKAEQWNEMRKSGSYGINLISEETAKKFDKMTIEILNGQYTTDTEATKILLEATIGAGYGQDSEAKTKNTDDFVAIKRRFEDAVEGLSNQDKRNPKVMKEIASNIALDYARQNGLIHKYTLLPKIGLFDGVPDNVQRGDKYIEGQGVWRIGNKGNKFIGMDGKTFVNNSLANILDEKQKQADKEREALERYNKINAMPVEDTFNVTSTNYFGSDYNDLLEDIGHLPDEGSSY